MLPWESESRGTGTHTHKDMTTKRLDHISKKKRQKSKDKKYVFYEHRQMRKIATGRSDQIKYSQN